MVDFNKKILNSDKFRLAAIFFKEHGVYTLAPRGTTDYNTYWDRETDRCLNGYVAEDGDAITGYHYFYLNYCPIMKLVEEEYTDRYGQQRTKRSRIFEFPSFWDGDYYYFNAIEEAENEGKHMAVLKCRQRGYEQPYSELIATPNGFTTMGSLQIGDEIWNPDGTPTKVVEIYEQGFKDVYQLELADGRTVRCGANHLWEVICANNKFKKKVIKTHDLLTNGLYNTVTVDGKSYNSYKYYLPPTNPVLYSEKELKIPAYVLGALLGDGALTKRTPKISSIDKPILDKILILLGDGFEFKYDPTTTCEYRIVDKERFEHKNEFVNGLYGVNRLHRWLEELDLCVSCEYKYIPDNYKYGSIEQRFELIRGLMDTDGYISKSGYMTFVNTSKQLIDDMAEVLRSLGILCSISKRDPGSGGTVDGRNIFGSKFVYIIYIKGNPDVFFLPRKRNRIKPNRKFSNKVAIVDIKYLGEQEKLRCITVDNPNHLYLTRDYIPTHNSFKGASMLVRNYELIPGSKNFAVASEQKFLVGDGILTKAWLIMDFVDKNTDWSKQRLTATRMERVSGFKVKDEFGKETEQGYLSSITGITLKNDPERLRGTRGKLVLFEEGGKFPGLETAWQIERPAVETDDGVAFGLLIAFGTGGTEGAAFDGLKNMFYHPDAFNALGFPNVWDDNAEGTKCGFFSPSYWNLESKDGLYMDADGNSKKDDAIERLIAERNKVREGGATLEAIDRFISERPMKPAEACLELGKNIFPKKLLMDLLTRIRTNTKLLNMKHIVDLSWDNGLVRATEKKSGDITKYPLKKDDKPSGSIVIWEYPINDPPFGLYIGGCLTPGETVWTLRGLVPVEQVVLGDNLVGKDGKYVSIKNIQLRDKVNESTYRIKPTGSYRTTNFTSEHPIWTGNRGFVNASELTTDDWLEIPNRYLSYFLDHKHQLTTDREKKFAYFCGLFTGDGFTNVNGNSHDVYMSIGKDEKDFAIFYDKLIEELFDRKCVHVHKNKELTRRFTHKELVEQLNLSIGTSAYNKRVPSWVMEGSYAVKLAFLQGFLDSDGSVLRDRNNIRINFTSVNLELLEDIQDLLFALEIKNSIVIHQKENTSKHGIHSLQSYRINVATDDNLKLAWNPVFESRKIKLAKETVVRGKSKMNIKFVNGSIWLKVEKIDKSCYTGVVYNFECETHTFMSRCIVTHNCDPYAKVSGFKIGQKRRTSRTDNTVLILLIAKGSKIV